MRRHVLSKLDDLDLDARELATAAARRAGLSLEEWAAAVLAGHEGDSPLSRERRPAGDSLDGIIARMAKTARPRLGHNYDALMTAVEAESRRQAQDQSSRTAIALESMASWIEQADERLNETARAAADHRNRVASALSQVLSTLKERLDTVERQAVSERPAARIEFPVQEALEALAPIQENLAGLRTDMSRLAQRLEQPDPAWTPAVNGIRSDIERLRSSLGGLATREEIAVLDQTIGGLARDLEQGRSTKDLLTLASSIAALYGQIQALSQEVGEGLHRRIGGEIDQIKTKIDQIAETGVDRSVVDFLSSQIVDMRHDLARRAEPQQIARLSDDVSALSLQIAEMRVNQMGRGDFAALKTSLENVCSALNRTVAAQEASDVPEQLQGLNQRLDVLARRPEPQPVNLDPITDQLSFLTERMASLSAGRADQADALAEMIARLSSQVQAVADREFPSQEPLMERFDLIEQELRQVGRQADTTSVKQMLRSIEEKLDLKPAQPAGAEGLEQQIIRLADRLAEAPGESLQKALDEATSHIKNLHDEAAGIAERAAKAALKDIQPSLPDPGDFDALKQGLVELKALHSRADKKTQETLRAVHDALETLVARFPNHGTTAAAPAPSNENPGQLRPADRLEAAVRRLHAATLNQIEEVSQALAEPAAPETQRKEPEEPQAITPVQEANLGSVRAGFIAAARRAAQTSAPDQAEPALPAPEPQDTEEAEPQEGSPTPASLMERLRRTFDSHRRPLLFGLAFLILAAGTVQILSGGQNATLLSSAPARETAQAQEIKPQLPDPVANTASIPAPVGETSLFQASSLAAGPTPSAAAAAAKFLVDPATVGEIPAQVPADLRQAALSGDAAAIFEVAARAFEGRGLAQDTALAARLCERAAQAGLPPAQARLAMLHEKGIGLPRDLKQAAVWYERAAQGGNIRAMHNLATLIASGVSGKADYAAALRWYGEAAEGGLKDSQYNMGVLLARGIGTRQDMPKAFKWFSLAAAQGDQDAARKRDDIAARLSAADLAAAKTAVEQWRARPLDPVANETPGSASGQTAALGRPLGNGNS